jgi:hypothetical protein
MHTDTVRVRIKGQATIMRGPKAGCIRRDGNVQ